MVLQIFAALLLFKYFPICRWEWGVGVEPNHTVYLVPTFTDGRGGGLGAISVAIKKTWSSIINYCEKIRQKLYTSPRGKQTCMG